MRAVTIRAAVLVAAFATCALGFAAACSSSPEDGSSSGGVATETGAGGDGPKGADGAVDGASESAVPGRCAETFGSALTEGYGRIDGVLHAVQKPSDTDCARGDREHLILQVLMQGAVYRLVIDIGSDRVEDDAKVRVALFPHALPQPEYAEGWQTGIPLDYANLLGAHSTDGGFAVLTPDQAVAKITGELTVGDPVSVYAHSPPNQPDTAERVHRNMPGTNTDGAIVIGPTSATPRFLLFHFVSQIF